MMHLEFPLDLLRPLSIVQDIGDETDEGRDRG